MPMPHCGMGILIGEALVHIRSCNPLTNVFQNYCLIRPAVKTGVIRLRTVAQKSLQPWRNLFFCVNP